MQTYYIGVMLNVVLRRLYKLAKERETYVMSLHPGRQYSHRIRLIFTENNAIVKILKQLCILTHKIC